MSFLVREELMSAELIREKVAEAREALIREFDDERSHHQKMLSDYTRLQQRFDNLQADMQLMASNKTPEPTVSINRNADSVITEMSDAGGDSVSLDGTETVGHAAYHFPAMSGHLWQN